MTNGRFRPEKGEYKMKTMRRVSVCFLAIVMVLSLAACGGGAETTVVLRGDLSADAGVPTTDTFTLTAKGDTVQTIKEVLEMDLSEYDDETKESFSALFDSLIVEPAQAIDGVTCTSRTAGNIYTIEMTVDCTGNAVKEAADAGILQIEGGSDKISLKRTQAGFEQQGYQVVE